jgi:hypothetical protein
MAPENACPDDARPKFSLRGKGVAVQYAVVQYTGPCSVGP